MNYGNSAKKTLISMLPKVKSVLDKKFLSVSFDSDIKLYFSQVRQQKKEETNRIINKNSLQEITFYNCNEKERQEQFKLSKQVNFNEYGMQGNNSEKVMPKFTDCNVCFSDYLNAGLTNL